MASSGRLVVAESACDRKVGVWVLQSQNFFRRDCHSKIGSVWSQWVKEMTEKIASSYSLENKETLVERRRAKMRSFKLCSKWMIRFLMNDDEWRKIDASVCYLQLLRSSRRWSWQSWTGSQVRWNRPSRWGADSERSCPGTRTRSRGSARSSASWPGRTSRTRPRGLLQKLESTRPGSPACSREPGGAVDNCLKEVMTSSSWSIETKLPKFTDLKMIHHVLERSLNWCFGLV